MATAAKRQKNQEETMQEKSQEGSTLRAWLRLCDPFIRTDGDIICPIIKAETSIRVLFRLQKKDFVIILHKVHKDTGIKTQGITFSKSSSDGDMQQNLFIQCVSPNIINEERLNHFKEKLLFYLSKYTPVKHISIDRVGSTEETIPEPMISEPDFEMHKLELCYKELSKIQPDSEEMDAVSFMKDSIKKVLDEFKEKRTKIAILSQNGKGKSFLLNLLFLLTIDSEKEYQSNNKKVILPKAITEDPTIEQLGETINQLPDVVKDFLKAYQNPQNSQEKFKTLMESICFELKPDIHDIEKPNKLFLSLPNYFKENGKIETEPYILAQKSVAHSYESTTKCIIHLRYGTIYQLKVDYFSSEDLKQQLFELVSLSGDANDETGFNKHIKDKAYECLQNRFATLTDVNISDINEKTLQNFKKYSDIVLCKEVEQFAGRTELYIGSGRNSTEDRLALKAIMKDLTSPQNSGTWKYKVAAVKDIVIYLPSKILYGGKEILEMPGTDDSDALALDFINKGLSMVDAVFVISEFGFKIAEKEVKDMLKNCEFMKKWKKCPQLSSLMFLAYPEKNADFQIKNGDNKKIEELRNLEENKRSAELTQFSNLIGMRSLPRNMADAVYTSCILPVLHTSIHAQEGIPHEVIQEHAYYLKFTGITKLITHLDTFISSSRTMDFQQLEKMLTMKTTKGLLAEHAGVLIQMYKKKDVKALREDTLFRQYDELRRKLLSNLKTVYTIKFDEHVENTLAEVAKEALETWDSNIENITSIGVFNPYFCGNHPTYKVKISEIILKDAEDLKCKIFAFLSGEITKLLKLFRTDAIDLFAQELDSVLELNGHKNIQSRSFVEESIRGVLSEALQWYIGRRMQPIDVHTVGKYVKESKKVVLKEHILIPAFNNRDLNVAKQLARKNIVHAVKAVKEELKTRLLKLHNTRWTSFSIHLKTKRGNSKPWQVLLSKLNQSCKNTNTQHQQQDELSVPFELITAHKPQ